MANERELRRALNRVWRELEAALSETIGGHLMVPPDARPLVESEWADEYERAGYGHRLSDTPEGFAAYADGFREHVWSRYEVGWTLRLSQLGAMRQNRSEAAPHGKEPTYWMAFARRLYLLAFVAERTVPLASLLDQRFSGASRRADWVALAVAWAATTPGHLMRAETLKREYYRARQDEYLCYRFFARVERDLMRATELVGALVLRALGEPPVISSDDEMALIRRVFHVATEVANALPPLDKAKLGRQVREAFTVIRDEQLSSGRELPYSTLIAASILYGGSSNAPSEPAKASPLRPMRPVPAALRREFRSVLL